VRLRHPLPIALLIALCTSPGFCAELKLPQGPDDFRALATPASSGPCERCGVVTDVRSASRQATGKPSPATTPSAGVGSNVAMTPIVGNGNTVKNARQAARPVTYYKLSVRFADGTFAFFEQDEPPAVVKGDTVEIVDGRVVARSAP
jgi:hypothetical protein